MSAGKELGMIATIVRDRQREEPWRDLVIPCREGDSELWFAEAPERIAEAKAMCRGCPVRAGCLTGALERREPWGVWGGELVVNGRVVAHKRGRGRPRKVPVG
jgi:WhiB family redox-sensing transcriptional regulator